jgi:hypothetical protein
VSDALIALGTLVVGVLATWFFAWLYYSKSSKELSRQSNTELRRFMGEQMDYVRTRCSTP